MKKIFITVSLLLSSFFILSAKPVDCAVNLSAGIPLYKSPELTVRKQLLSSDDYKRIAFGCDFNFQANFSEPVKAVGGLCSFADFVFDSKDYHHSIDYTVYAGIRVYPNLAGFNFTIANCLGSRSDFVKSDGDSVISYAKWGNGFLIDLNYDFYKDSGCKFMPELGISYRFMPRGNYSYDHIFSAYAGIKF